VEYATQTTANQAYFGVDFLLNYGNSNTGSRELVITSKVELKFRGETYYGVVEGYKVSANPSNTRVTLYFSPQDQNDYLILNDAVYGTLGTSVTYPGNKLGF
jgi:hypothetical protein